jgi:hypothetical protein
LTCGVFLRGTFCVVQLLLICSSGVWAQGLRCAAVNPDSGPLGYRERGGDPRCEGLYRSPVAGAALELLSLTSGPIDFSLRPDTVLYVASPDLSALKAAKLTLQARALPLGTYYRMDATIDSGVTFKWPASALDQAKLTHDLIGVVGWVEQNSNRVYLPVSVSDGSRKTMGTVSLIAILRASADIEQLSWRTWPDAKSATRTSWENLNSNYRAGQPIRLELKINRGTALLELAAKTVGSDDWVNIIASIYQP